MSGDIIIDVIYNNAGGVYFAGQIVDGHVRLTVPNSTVKLGGINLRWLGQALVSWSEGTGDDSRSYFDKETYFDTTIVLVEKKPYQGEHSKLHQGVYIYPFAFQLPFDIPNSYQGFSGWVRYEVMVTVMRSWAFNISKSVPFTVISHLDLNTLPYVTTKGIAEDEKTLCCLCCKSGPITASITTDRLGYVPGEDITFTAEIHNNSDTDMHPCKATLSMSVSYHANISTTTGSFILCKLRGPGTPPGGSCLWERQRLHIPPLPPSFLHGCKLIDIQYFVSLHVQLTSMNSIQLHITVDPVGPSSALFVPLMIVIGTIPLKTTTHIIPQLVFRQSHLVKNDLAPLYPYYNFKISEIEEARLTERR